MEYIMQISTSFLQASGINLHSNPADYYETLIDPVIDISDSVYIGDTIKIHDTYEPDFDLSDKLEFPMAQTFMQETLDEISAKLGFSLGKVMVH